ncbi:MAG: response regulator transcription factor [Pseudohongiellaceae bacterium]|nr:response regulator transcription factor [Pseudohongiellaceae bacterium]
MTTSPSILIVDDDKDIRDLLHKLLSAEGYHCRVACDGDEMFVKLEQSPSDLILLDVMMPGRDGFQLCRELQHDPSAPPVIMLTAKDDEIDRVVGLELGADDYVVKPFGKRELIARIKVVLRRLNASPSTNLNAKGNFLFADWCFKPAQMELVDGDATVIPLSSSESELLLAFVQNPQIPLSRDRLLDMTKGRNSAPFDRSVDSHISRLRRKLRDDAKNPEIIKTSWGKGYVFTYTVESV